MSENVFAATKDLDLSASEFGSATEKNLSA